MDKSFSDGSWNYLAVNKCISVAVSSTYRRVCTGCSSE